MAPQHLALATEQGLIRRRNIARGVLAGDDDFTLHLDQISRIKELTLLSWTIGARGWLVALGCVLIAEFALHVLGGIWLAVDLDVGIDEEVERWPVLLGHESQIAPHGKRDAILGQVAEIVFNHLGIFVLHLVGFRNIDRDPTSSRRLEFGPAVVASNLPRTSGFGQRKAHLELGRCR